MKRLVVCLFFWVFAVLSAQTTQEETLRHYGEQTGEAAVVKCWQKGTAGTVTFVKVCVSSAHGVKEFSVNGREHIKYGAIAEGVDMRWDDADGNKISAEALGFRPEMGWRSVSVSYPTTTSMRVVRVTYSGDLKLDQLFTVSLADKKVTITMTVTNLSSREVKSTCLCRFSDIDASATGVNAFVASGLSVAGTGIFPNRLIGLEFQAVGGQENLDTVGYVPWPDLGLVGDWDCGQLTLYRGTVQGDEIATARWILGDLPVGRAETRVIKLEAF